MAFSVGMLRDTAELICEGSGSRSPLNSRFTVKAGGPALKPAPAVGPAAKNGMRLTKNRASEVAPKAPVIRTNSCLAIGLLHGAKPIKQATDQTHQKAPAPNNTADLTWVGIGGFRPTRAITQS